MRVYCHFSFIRPRGKKYGIFAAALYGDAEGKKLLVKKVRKYDLWENHQYISAIQAYEHALQTIFDFQGQMVKAGVEEVMLVTDNSILAGWIENPYKHKKYAPYMDRAVRMYRAGETKALAVGVGLCEVRESEKSFKYCKEQYVENTYVPKGTKKAEVRAVPVQEYKSIMEIMEKDIAVPEVKGIKELAPE